MDADADALEGDAGKAADATNPTVNPSNPGGGIQSLGESSPMHALIRSKGFIWLSNSHTQMFYWALAGKHFELKQYATWWSCVPRDEWPIEPSEVATIEKEFDDGWIGDHRQELVLIGVRMNKEAIVKLLDDQAGGLHQNLGKRGRGLRPLHIVHPVHLEGLEHQAHLPARGRRRRVVLLHRLPPLRFHFRSGSLREQQSA